MLLIVIKNNVFKNKGIVIPVTWYSTFIRFWFLITWLIAWLILSATRAVFQTSSLTRTCSMIYKNQIEWWTDWVHTDKQLFTAIEMHEDLSRNEHKYPLEHQYRATQEKMESTVQKWNSNLSLWNVSDHVHGVRGVDFAYVSTI